MRKFEYRYKIDEDHKTVVAMSTFAGKPVSGVARCDDSDIFNINDGKELSAARCSVKIAEKRMKRAELQHSLALEELKYWTDRVEKMRQYDFDAVKAYQKAVSELAEIEKRLCE
jgi:uncharacterized protein (DUF3084 family)